MNRKDFLKTTGSTLIGSRLLAAQSRSQERFTLRNLAFELTVTKRGPERLVRIPTGTVLADRPYHYPFTVDWQRMERRGPSLVLRGASTDGVELEHSLHVPAGEGWIEEQIKLTNRNSYPLHLPHARAGFVLSIPMPGGKVHGASGAFRFTAVPFRREPNGGPHQYADYTVEDVLTRLRVSTLRSTEGYHISGKVVSSYAGFVGLTKTEYAEYASEGWCWQDGQSGCVISKYSQEGMEWAVLDRLALSAEEAGLRWGGFCIFEGDPEHAAVLPAGESYTFGANRIIAYKGGLNEGFYAYRAAMAARGMGCPRDFNPPVHWNELYDNKLWGLGEPAENLPANRQKYYGVADLRQEAEKAKAIGCENLYLDPGWDTSFASKIWDAERLGTQKEFARMLRDEYNLGLSLHTPMSGWCDATSYPEEMLRLNREGARVTGSLCGASRLYREETLRRLNRLAADGAQYFMFDGTVYHSACWDPNHGHPVPARREEHVASLNQLARLVHAQYPNLLIEMHGQVLGGSSLRYVPLYYGYGNAGFDEVWAFELMWDPMEDLVRGHSIALYYYNLAYSLPLYLHIDLRKDNPQALMFWWNASTCRHLGIGGTHKDPKVTEAHFAAMKDYMRLKIFFTAGVFYGIDELTHLHRHPSQSSAVVNCFNLEPNQVSREVVFIPGRFAMEANLTYRIEGARFRQISGGYAATVEIPAYGHRLLTIAAT